ncbi:glutaredoxin family protein [Clostridium sp. 19966]|uniref:glutaredoxin family protein n=1 Tax=Clostridium sp. 19966 TaxID=2768166 RepID=UPI0028DF43E7|nr:glutaredoxin family protein [Clostridium sp. 19966]MDT8717306.1 glutaredoxin family protein [Clostridium sp. 19966]
MKNIVVYTSDSCPYCMAVKGYLSQKGMNYEERNVKTSEYRKELIELGFMSVPVVKINEEVIQGFDMKAIDKALDA